MKHFSQLQIEFVKKSYYNALYFNPYETFESFVRGQLFYHPQTRNRVQFHSLPSSMQNMIKSRWEQKQHDTVLQNIGTRARQKTNN